MTTVATTSGIRRCCAGSGGFSLRERETAAPPLQKPRYFFRTVRAVSAVSDKSTSRISLFKVSS
ncbi:MAG TPA: hypothetical protein VGN31_15655, partial [Paraburkholderia sp.]